MTKCKECGQEFQPIQPYHRYCDDCWRKDHYNQIPPHPRLGRANPETIALSVALAAFVWLLGRIFRWW